MVFKFWGEKYFACHAGCRDSYKEDKRRGLIYGPYKLNGKFVSPAVFSMAEPRACIYCGKPKGEDH